MIVPSASLAWRLIQRAIFVTLVGGRRVPSLSSQVPSQHNTILLDGLSGYEGTEVGVGFEAIAVSRYQTGGMN